MSGRKTIDVSIRLTDELDRTVTMTLYRGAPVGDVERVGRNYLYGWNERGRAMFGDVFGSRADGFQVHDENGRILASG